MILITTSFNILNVHRVVVRPQTESNYSELAPVMQLKDRLEQVRQWVVSEVP
jgi:hypothetical protein